MSRKFLPTALAILTTLVATGSAQAQEKQPRGARFDYAPNIWKAEEVRMPRAAAIPVHAVKHGSMPQGSNFLGLDPSDLTPPPVIAQRPATTSVTPQVFVPRTQYSSNFGKPVSTQPMTMAPLSQPAAAPMTAPQASSAKPSSAKVARPSGSRRSSQSLSGKLRRPANPVGQAAKPAAASYGEGFGYVAGGSVAQAGVTANGTVTGKVLLPNKNKR